MASHWLCHPSGGYPPASTTETRIQTGPVYVGFVTMGQGFLRVLRPFCVSIIPQMVHTRLLIYHQRYVISATDSVLKLHTKMAPHSQRQ
jgi:hypothetical protein